MKHNISKWVCGLAMVAVAHTSYAIPITGSLDFFAVGTFTSTDSVGAATDGTGDGYLRTCADGITPIALSSSGNCSLEGGVETGPATGVDFAPDGTSLPQFGPVLAAAGTLDTDYGVIGTVASLTDVDLNNLPQTEFSIDLSGTLGGVLSFVIETGTEIDNSTPGMWDIGGTGFFNFTCNDVDDPNCESAQTNGNWSISSAGGQLVVGFNAVPAPSVLALFGLGLMGLGVLRARRRV